MIEVKNLTKYYGDKPGVRDVSFTIEDRSIVGLLGPNGAGKSTLMKMLTGYHMPTSGEIIINGIDAIAKPKEALKAVGFMPEIPPLYVDMTVEDFLSFCAKIRGVGKKELKEHVHLAMEKADICHVAGRLIRNLSKGYRQRVGLAQALIGQPEILIMDEPTVGLDPKQMAEFRQLMLNLGKDHTIIISSHILSEINQICEKILIFNKGRLVAQDSVENLEDSMLQGDCFLLKLKADREKAIRLLSGLEGIRELQDCSDGVGQADSCCLRIEGQGDGLRERIFRCCAQENMPILELNSQRLSLEQVFLQLTEEEGKAEEA